MNDLLKLAIDGHGGTHRWEQLSRFRAATSITGAIWALKGKPGLLEDVVLDGETRDQRLTITPFPQPGWYTTWEPYRQTIETSDGVIAAERRDPAALPVPGRWPPSAGARSQRPGNVVRVYYPAPLASSNA